MDAERDIRQMPDAWRRGKVPESLSQMTRRRHGMVATTSEKSRKNKMKAVAEAYFAGLARKDVSNVPWASDVVLRSPLAPGGLDVPLRGRKAVADWFASLYPVLGKTKVIEHYFNDEMTVIATRADVGITTPPCAIRVIDRFTINEKGEITEQENHYDPRPALQ
jgi:hypothetical protein